MRNITTMCVTEVFPRLFHTSASGGITRCLFDNRDNPAHTEKNKALLIHFRPHSSDQSITTLLTRQLFKFCKSQRISQPANRVKHALQKCYSGVCNFMKLHGVSKITLKIYQDIYHVPKILNTTRLLD